MNQVTVITATYNAQEHLPKLMASLRNQTCKDFNCIIVDGGSTDNTLSIVEENKDLITLSIVGPDFGIYDALNKAILKVSTPYYIVVGSDDTLAPKAIELYSEAAIETGADIISANVSTGSGTLRPLQGRSWHHGHLAYVSQHAVGSMIKTSLHEKVGLYSKYYPIAADRYFLLNAIENYGCIVEAREFIAGYYSFGGISNSRRYEALLDLFKVDFALAKTPSKVLMYSLMRYIKNIPAFLISKK